MSTTHDLTLQIALAKELPKLIEPLIYNDEKFIWRDTNRIVTPREWDWIVRECEKKLTEEQRLDFMLYLCDGTTTHSDLGKWTVCDRLLSAPWQTRAIAYFKTIGKEIK